MTFQDFGFLWQAFFAVLIAAVSVAATWGSMRNKNKNVEKSLDKGNKHFENLENTDRKVEKRIQSLEYDVETLQKDMVKNKEYCKEKFKDLQSSLCKKIDNVEALIKDQNQTYKKYIKRSMVYQGIVTSSLKTVMAHLLEDTDFTKGNEGLRSLIESNNHLLNKLEYSSRVNGADLAMEEG